jgi:hypothetical protein
MRRTGARSLRIPLSGAGGGSGLNVSY